MFTCMGGAYVYMCAGALGEQKIMLDPLEARVANDCDLGTKFMSS